MWLTDLLQICGGVLLITYFARQLSSYSMALPLLSNCICTTGTNIASSAVVETEEGDQIVEWLREHNATLGNTGDPTLRHSSTGRWAAID